MRSPARCSIAWASSACTISRPSKVAISAHRRLELLGVQRRELVDAGVQQEALEAEDAGVVQRAQVGHVAGDGAAPEADVDVRLACAALRLTSSAATSTVGGMLLSGMSTSVVTPPAAAARVALAKPSHSVRPGSLTCTWESTRPGSSDLVVREAR